MSNDCYTHDDYPAHGIFIFKNPETTTNPFQEAEEYRKCVLMMLADPETIEELNEWSSKVPETRKFMRRIQAKTPSDIVPQIVELSAEPRFQTEYEQYLADSKKWVTEHKGLDFEHYWEMMYRACMIAANGFVEY